MSGNALPRFHQRLRHLTIILHAVFSNRSIGDPVRPAARAEAGDRCLRNRVVMEETLGAALAALFKQTDPAATPAIVKRDQH
jgi:hypothetical protein